MIPSTVAVGFSESLAAVSNAFDEHGSFDGILGFSQGAAMVALICGLMEREGKTRKDYEQHLKLLFVSNAQNSSIKPVSQY